MIHGCKLQGLRPEVSFFCPLFQQGRLLTLTIFINISLDVVVTFNFFHGTYNIRLEDRLQGG